MPPGQTADVTVTCDPRLWRRWNPATARWDTLPGQGELLIARGLGDIRLRLPAPPPDGSAT